MVVIVRGRLTMQYGSRLHKEVKQLIEGGARQVVVDLSDVSFIDSYGLGQMVACQTTLKAKGGHMRFAGITEKTMDLIKMSGVPRILQIDPDVATSLAHLSGS